MVIVPQRIGRPCAASGCPAVIRSGRFCPAHERNEERSRDHERGSASQRGYGVLWRRLRAMFLRQHPLCADPFNEHKGRPVAATDVDHIVPRARGGTDAFANLQALCHSCHSRKTALADGRWTGQGRGA